MNRLTSSTHPPLPPTTEEFKVSWLRLLRSRRVGVSTFYNLMEEYGCAEAAMRALPGVANAAGEARYSPFARSAAQAEYHAGRLSGAELITREDPAYPDALAQISDAPPLLWAHGDLSLLERPMVALVGARNASSLGLRMARKLALGLAEAGVVVVSGLARGIDTVVHDAALKGGTIAVQAGGIDTVYPAENAALQREISLHGLRLSEQPVGLAPQARHFPRRNRIISGLCQSVVVIEAASKSGSLITARTALDQGREVLAVPGHPFDARAWGSNTLIRDGASLVRGIDDILETLRPMAPSEPVAQAPQADMASTAPPPPKRTLREATSLHRDILARLGPAPIAEDQLIRDLGSPVHAVTSALQEMELLGEIERQSGGLLARLEGDETPRNVRNESKAH